MAHPPPAPSPDDEDLLAVLAAGISLRSPSPELRERVVRAGTPQPLTFLERGQGIWLPSADASVATKELYCDSGDRLATRLVRLGDGAPLPVAALPGLRTVVVVQGALASPVMSLETGDSMELVGERQDWCARGDTIVLELGTGHFGGHEPHDEEGSAPWTEIGPGLRARLMQAGVRELMVVDAEPAATLSEHEHAGIEELFVIRGSCEVQGRWMHVGDYHRAMPGSHHDITRAGSEGCVLVSSVRQLG
ncbi:MAG: cupin domain-containing protein [Cytophagaceae bacterium]|nr:cupin domain-containing protein [Gemmatimonadaceae bacterium]